MLCSRPLYQLSSYLNDFNDFFFRRMSYHIGNECVRIIHIAKLNTNNYIIQILISHYSKNALNE